VLQKTNLGGNIGVHARELEVGTDVGVVEVDLQKRAKKLKRRSWW